jgi:hypothetical protein
MKALTFVLTLSLLAGTAPVGMSQSLEAGFAHPPHDTKPWCYWYWISDHMSKEGLTRDLEAMARIGIGEAFIGNIFLDDVPAGSIKVLTPEWWALVEHAIREGGRLGVNIGMFNCPGWSQSGGPWIRPDQAMRHLAFSETRVTGPRPFAAKLPRPKEIFQDVAVLAFPAPVADADSIARQSPKITCTPFVSSAAWIADEDAATVLEFPANAGRGSNPFTIEFEVARPFTARSLEIIPAEQPFGAQVDLQVADAEGHWRSVRQFKCDRSNMSPGVGFMPRGAATISFPETTGTRYRVVFTGGFGGGQALRLAEVSLSGAARLEAFVEKQLGKMHPTPLPLWDTYLWPTQPEPEHDSLVVLPMDIQDLTSRLAADGTLTWEVPAGEWILLRAGMTPTGMRNSPASPEGQGLEVDKMNRTLARHHFEAFIGELLRRMPAKDRKAFTRVVADSYEMGSQNWTDGFAGQFEQRYGYDPRPWLPVLTGRLVGGADRSERFLWDLRRLVADRVATDYVGGLREACAPHGLGLWLENYGHWGFPSEFLKYGSESDRIGGEYWVTGDLGSIECRAAASCANTYGKRFVSAEAFTGGPPFQNAPGALKARGDWSFCEGVNHFVLHVYIHQPWEDKVPGLNAWFGTEFNRHNTWFDHSKAWVDYVRRCCWLLQQGTRVADVAYFIGEDAPKMTGVRRPELPPGRDFDYLNAEVIQENLRVENGWLTLPHGTRYRVLVLPEQDTMRPELLGKIRDLVKAGATVLGPPPWRSPSLEGYPDCDRQVREIAAALWGSAAAQQPGERRVGLGRVIWGQSLVEALTSLALPSDFESSALLRFTHRRSNDGDFYFVANPNAEPLTTTAGFRVGARAPEFWWPDSGRIERPAIYDVADGIVRLPLSLGPHGSVFVVFRTPAAPPSERIVSVARNGLEVAPQARTLPRLHPSAHDPGLQITREGTGWVVAATVSGDYSLAFADGRKVEAHVGALPAGQAIVGPWDVRFSPGWGAPQRTTFDQLVDWTQHHDPGIRHYSGRATYRATFEWPAPRSPEPKSRITPPGSRFVLDLGNVRDLATIRVNGHECGALWLAPWTVDLTAALRPGVNELEVEVVNVWNNRLVGDQSLPRDQRRTFLLAPTVNPDAPLLSAGLLGPVTLHTVASRSLPDLVGKVTVGEASPAGRDPSHAPADRNLP